MSSKVYRKKTFSGVCTKFKSFIPENTYLKLVESIKSLLFMCFSLYPDFIKFYHYINKLKSILYKKSYPCDLVGKCIKELKENTEVKTVIAL